MTENDFIPTYIIVNPPEPIIPPMVNGDVCKIPSTKYSKSDRYYEKAITKRRKRNKNSKTHRRKWK